MKTTHTENTKLICPSEADVASAGGFIKVAEAATRLANYFLDNKLDRHNPDLIFGQIFSLANIRLLVQKIDDYNLTPDGVKSPIAGIRIYNAMSIRTYLPAPRNITRVPDVLIVPVLASGDDLYKDINPPKKEDEGDIILSDGRPCPNQCASSFYK